MTSAVLFSRKKDLWTTPKALFEQLNEEFGPFDLDAAANAKNHLCENWLGPGGLIEDALKEEWGQFGRFPWCNPPFSLLLKFVQQAVVSSMSQTDISCPTILIPSRTDTRHFKQCWDYASKIVFIEGRIKFEDDSGTMDSAPFPSLVAHFDFRERIRLAENRLCERISKTDRNYMAQIAATPPVIELKRYKS